jgi:hypothetical protein
VYSRLGFGGSASTLRNQEADVQGLCAGVEINNQYSVEKRKKEGGHTALLLCIYALSSAMFRLGGRALLAPFALELGALPRLRPGALGVLPPDVHLHRLGVHTRSPKSPPSSSGSTSVRICSSSSLVAFWKPPCFSDAPRVGVRSFQRATILSLGAKADAPGFQVPPRHVVRRLKFGIQKAYKGP